MARDQQLVPAALPSTVKTHVLPILFLLLVLTQCGREETVQQVKLPLSEDTLHTIFSGLYDAQQLPSTGTTPPIPVAIVPHHLTAASGIAAGIKALAPHHPRSILLLSPDHFDACPTLLCTAAVSLESTLGSTESDPEVLSNLGRSSLVTKDASFLPREHGITAVTPFISRLLPGTRVTPVIVSVHSRWHTQADDIFTVIQNALGSDTILVVSSDFSHYLPLNKADEADEKTARALLSKDLPAIAGLENPSQSDCPACLWIASRIAENRRSFNPSVLLHTNSARLLHDESNPETTSHFSIVFYQNASLNPSDLSFAGDVTVTRADEPPELSSAARSFWNGSGMRVVNLEGPLSTFCSPAAHPYAFCNTIDLWESIRDIASHWSVENNHMLDQGVAGKRTTISLISHNDTESALTTEGIILAPWRIYAITNTINPVSAADKIDVSSQYREVLDQLRTHDAEQELQVIYVHAGTEFSALTTDSEARYLRSFVDVGADVVLAVHSHVPGDMEMYHGAPIFRGLGNVIFDQTDDVSTSTAKMVRLRSDPRGIAFETHLAQ